MNLSDITTKCWILALFERDDGERLLLGDGWYDFKDSLQHFQPNNIASDIVELQGTDGQLLAGQVRRSASQNFDGYIGDALTSKTVIESRRRDFIQFFRVRRFYKVIYIFPDGSAIQRRRGYLTDAPSVPEMWQKFPEYHVAVNFEDVNYYEYSEDSEGEEVYANTALIDLLNLATSGLVWDEDGAVSHGYTWLEPVTLTGDYITISDALDSAPLSLLELDGDATQDGTPTPDVPIAVNTVTGEQTITVTDGSDSQSQEINLGKNLLPTRTGNTSNGLITTVNADGSLHVAGTITASWANVGVITSNEYYPAGTYTFSIGDVGGYWWEAIPKMADGSWGTAMQVRPDGIAQVPTRTYTQPIVGTRMTIGGSGLTAGTEVDITVYPQIEAGSTATSYAPYFTPIELAKIGTYQDRIYKDEGKWYIEKQVGKVVLDGSETWTVGTGGGLRLFYGAQYPDALASNQRQELLANNFHFIASGNETGAGFIYQQRFYFYWGTTDDDATAFKTWLTTHPTTVYYALATPTTTEITDETLLEQLEHIYSLYEGVDHISITPTAGAQGTMEVQYYTVLDTTGAGYEWEPGGDSSTTTVEVAGIDNAEPIWTVTGPATNPTLTNITTGQAITWNGTVPNGQKLVIDMAEQTATLAGANVYQFISGSWITLRPGPNKLSYSATGGADQPSQLGWNGVVG